MVATIIVLLLAGGLFAQSLLSLYLMLYAWEYPERLDANRGPRSFVRPRLTFTVLLPARQEEPVIYQTVKRVASANYPLELLEIVVVCHASDMGTIAEAMRAVREIGSSNVRVETFTGEPVN